MEISLQDLAAAALERTPARPAIEFEDRWVTWGELRRLADAVQSLLAASGIRPDAPVAFIPRNRPAAIGALLALIAQNRNVQMIYGFQSPQGIARDIERLEPAALVADLADYLGEVREALADRGIAGLALAGMTAATVHPFERAGPAAALRRGPEARQIEIFTSGTTGPPKQFPISYDLIAKHHVGGNRLPFLDDQQTLEVPPALLYFPVGNISGLYSTLPSILKGQRAVMLDRFSLEAWRRHVVRDRPTFSGIPPSFFRALLEADIPKQDLASLQVMGAGAAPLDPEIQRAFEQKYGIPILISYGATEFGGPVTAMTAADRAEFGEAKIGSVGRPIPGARVRVVAPETGEPLGPGAEGLLEVVSPRIGPHWIRTADVGTIDQDGFVYHLGRADGAIVRGGFKILPETIEKALKLHPAVADAVVVGVPDERLGQVPAAAVRLHPGIGVTNPSVLEVHLRKQVVATHIPAKWLFCQDYPRTISAKIDRPGVRRLFL